MDEKIYEINNKKFHMKNDFTYGELAWLDTVFERLAKETEISENKNEVRGNFTKEDIEMTLKMLLESEDKSAFTRSDFMNCSEGLSVVIIADFFLRKAILGAAMQNSFIT